MSSRISKEEFIHDIANRMSRRPAEEKNTGLLRGRSIIQYILTDRVFQRKFEEVLGPEPTESKKIAFLIAHLPLMISSTGENHATEIATSILTSGVKVGRGAALLERYATLSPESAAGVISSRIFGQREQVPGLARVSERKRIVSSRKIKEMASHKKSVFTLENKQVMIACSFVEESPVATITLKVEADRYIKLRDIRIVKAHTPIENPSAWIAVGQPVVLYIHKQDFQNQVDFHESYPFYFGPSELIQKAVDDFFKNTATPLSLVATQDRRLDKKLTTEISQSGQLRAVFKKKLGHGSSKLLFKNRFFDRGATFARAKLSTSLPKDGSIEKLEESFREDVANMTQEAYYSQYLREQGVPHIISIQRSRGQNIQKIRLDLEYAKTGTLGDLVEKGFFVGKRREALQYAFQVAEALAGIHRAKLAHNDFKLDNCLINEDEALVCDFGEIKPIGDMKSLCGTYPSPESVAVMKTYTCPSTAEKDCWAYGLALYALLYGPEAEIKIRGATYSSSSKKILAIAKEIREELSESLEIEDKVIVQLLDPDPQNRLSMEEVVRNIREALSL